jgi:hypothetical protein
MSELQALCESKGLKADFRYGEATEPSDIGPHNWRVKLTYRGRRLTVNFYGGDMVTNPSAADVIGSLCLDTSAGEQSFADFCSDFGYDVDSRKAEKIWKACATLAPKVRRLLGDDFDTFARAEH